MATPKRPNGNSGALSQKDEPGRSHQSEAASRRLESQGPDGTVRSSELRAERTWSGALPRPEDFAKYNEIVPNAAERILLMAEREQAHRIKIESAIIPENLVAGHRGQKLGAVISIIALLLAAGTAVIGAHWQVSIALVGVPVIGVARSLVSTIRNRDTDE